MEWANGINESTVPFHPEENYELGNEMIPDEETDVDNANNINDVINSSNMVVIE